MRAHKRPAVFAAALAAIFATAAAPGAGAADRPAPEQRAPRVGPFQIKNHGVGRCLGFPAGDDRMRVWNCTSEPYQLWDLIADGRGAYHVATRGDGRCLAGWAQGPERWATWLSDCDRSFTNEDQLWYVHPAHSAEPATIANLFGRVLEPDRAWGGANEAPVVIHSPDGRPNQQWTLVYGP
ncbi:RICIN domain-containing protein [Streptomyces spectabilis]|uniref:Ricin B lectin domain-containing protein n=1 Tax=Streptomyces spectabilis TaxID=68270 RepID=A0A5P2WZH3_STRST|nr:RICIN domain-containing protein [Streptomyces spectabilis]MBB5101444.1 hypothetical protein [Streptomyces spectabilis]MCI3900636.1 ricin-type beta-trefoil lectin domain protein [Streptomyces spectabilis]QEV58187.1 hypothetical protein CP982_05230 [Streptomyces spectabilis]GGV11458.1 hypothetical protein GCM10010245_21280 [Streptomyces spectabilis]